MRLRSVLGAAVVVLLPLDCAHAQGSAWRIWAGHESFTFRDVASSKPPVDGSPVVWRGDGPTLTAGHERSRPFRLHRFEVTASTDGGFVYDTGVDVTPRPGGDSATFVAGRYDYLRYLRRHLFVDGLQAAIGVRGLGERRVLKHHYGGDVALDETDVTGTIAYIAALRVTRFRRLGLDVELADGLTLAHGTQRHRSDVESIDVSWGAGWRTDVAARADVRLTSRTSIQVSYRREGEGLLFDHRSYTSGRRGVMVGVIYAR